MKRFYALGLLVSTGLAVMVFTAAAQQPQQVPPLDPKVLQQLPKNGAVNAQQGQGEPVKASEPKAFTSKEGKKGWKVTIPGGRALATPAVAQGKLLVGGGFGSHEFYAFDANTGKTLWLYQTGDDGPTAAVVEDGYVAFNTESCELEIITLDGKRVWKKWLGDPLMSMPAISRGKVYMAYPDSKGDEKHRLACFDVKTGQELWKKDIAGEIITAPVIEGDKIYLACLEGTMYCFEQDGKLAWSEKKNATSSPLVYGGKCYFSTRKEVMLKDLNGKQVKQQLEELARREIGGGGLFAPIPGTDRHADYLDLDKRVQSSKIEKQNKAADSGVGFSVAPQAANLPQAMKNLGQATVAGVWSYQGSRPFMYKDKMYSVMGDTLKCVDPKDEKVLWKKEWHKDKQAVDANVTPPAIVNGKLFVGTAQGEVLCLSVADGAELWRATIGEPIAFQPAVADGRVYVATANGHLFCIETGDSRDHGWLMWGANAQHNGAVRK